MLIFTFAFLIAFYMFCGWYSLRESTPELMLPGVTHESSIRKRRPVVVIGFVLAFLIAEILIVGLIVRYWPGFLMLLIRTIMGLSIFCLWTYFVIHGTRGKWIGLGLGITIPVLQYLWPNWLTTNTIILLTTAFILLASRGLHPSVLLLASLGIFAYDIVGVYGTDMIRGVVEGVSTAPLMLQVPVHLGLDADTLLFVGIGDIAFPGFWVMVAYRLGHEFHKPALPAATLAGLVVGWVVSVLVLVTTQHPVPAMMTILPCVVPTFLVTARLLGITDRPATAA